jgi:hypothetical protein
MTGRIFAFSGSGNTQITFASIAGAGVDFDINGQESTGAQGGGVAVRAGGSFTGGGGTAAGADITLAASAHLLMRLVTRPAA